MSTLSRPIDRVIEVLGGPSKTASAFNIDNPSVVMNWRNRGQVPFNRVIEAEALTGISRHDLRPDIFGPAPKQGAAA